MIESNIETPNNLVLFSVTHNDKPWGRMKNKVGQAEVRRLGCIE